MAYDPALGEMVEFGGNYEADGVIYVNPSTYAFNGLSWTELSTEGSPPARYAASMAYDAAIGKLVLYGGTSGTSALNDTWTLDGTTWQEVPASPSGSPPAMYDTSMAYDPITGNVVLFGGYNDGDYAETWTFNGTAWGEQTLSPNPGGSFNNAMAYDPELGQIVLYGGLDSNDTWVYDGSSWSQLSPATNPGTGYPSMDYDVGAGQLLMVKAPRSSGPVTTWEFIAGNWIEQSPAQSPSWRLFFAAAYDLAIDRMVLLGGSNGSTSFGDTWLYGVPAELTQTSDTFYEVTQGQIDDDLGLQGSNLEVSGASGQVTYTTTTSSSNLMVSPAGAITALSTTPPGDYTISGTDVDALGNTGTWAFEVQVAAAPVLILPGGNSLPPSTVGVPYSQQFSASLSPGPYTFSVTAGTLPPLLSLSPGGLLSGTPTTEGSYSFTVTATASAGYGASVSTSLAVAPASMSVSPSSLPGAVSGYPYEADLTLNGGTGGASFALAPGSSLPSWLNLSSTGVLSGTPPGAATASFSVVATDGDDFSTTVAYQLIVEASASSAGITISPSSLPSSAIGAQYDEQLSASGGTGPYSWAVMGGNLPAGFSMTSGGLVYGKWNEGESGQFTVTATDSTGASTLTTFELVVQSQGVVISPASLAVPTIDYGQADPQVFTISGGTAPYGWDEVGGSLPYGMSLSVSGSTLTLEGTAQQSGTFTFTLNAYDSFDNLAAQTYILTVNPYPTITVKPTLLPGKAPIVGVPWSVKLKASGGTAPYNFSLEDGEFPPGITVSSSGVLSGTPTLAGADEGFAFQVEAIDANGYAGYQNYNLYITTPKIKLDPAVLPDPEVGDAYVQLITASGGGLPYNYALTAGALPAGLNLASDGAITGTPTTPGPVAKFTITVTDANGYTKAISYKVAVLGSPSFTSDAVAVVHKTLAGTKISITTTGSYPAPLITVTGTLPAGLSFKAGDNGTASISGKDTAGAGSYPVTVTANNLAGGIATQSLVIWVYSGQLLPPSKVFYPGSESSYTLTTQIPADLITISGLPSWVSVEPGNKPDKLVISGTPPSGTGVGTYPATVAIEGLAAPAKPPKFAVIVGA